jgi:hypothetical protein
MLHLVALVRTDILFLLSVLRLVVTVSIVSNSPILVTLMMEAIRDSETSALTRPTRHNIHEDGIIHMMCVISEVASQLLGIVLVNSRL